MNNLDPLDVEILTLMQLDGRASMAEIGGKIGLSASAVTRRLEKLEGDRVILGYTARVNHKAVGLRMTAFVRVTLTKQSEDVIEAFEKAIVSLPEVAEVHLMAGSTDYLLRVISTDLEAYESFLKRRLTRLRGVAHVQTAFSLSSLKTVVSVPLTHLIEPKGASKRAAAR
jgi:Lrp/AsnC family leucine-responsive transcriptional regulator